MDYQESVSSMHQDRIRKTKIERFKLFEHYNRQHSHQEQIIRKERWNKRMLESQKYDREIIEKQQQIKGSTLFFVFAICFLVLFLVIPEQHQHF